MSSNDPIQWHGTTILCVRKGSEVVIAGDGQVSMGQTVMKSNARKVRRLAGGDVMAGIAGATAVHPVEEAGIELAFAQAAEDVRSDAFLQVALHADVGPALLRFLGFPFKEN